MAEDSHKDQTFFLCHIKQEALRKTLFPVGDLLKSRVRQIAREAGLDHVANRRDSTGICFIGKRQFQEFIDQVTVKQLVF
jgi:tRNA U34 2-thiouridine synthase MnmA/TrmU